MSETDSPDRSTVFQLRDFIIATIGGGYASFDVDKIAVEIIAVFGQDKVEKTLEISRVASEAGLLIGAGRPVDVSLVEQHAIDLLNGDLSNGMPIVDVYRIIRKHCLIEGLYAS